MYVCMGVNTLIISNYSQLVRGFVLLWFPTFSCWPENYKSYMSDGKSTSNSVDRFYNSHRWVVEWSKEACLLSWIKFASTADGVFLQPPKPVLSPLNAIAYFNCTVVNATINGWNLQFNSGNQQAYMNWPLHRVALTARGIQATQSQAGSRMDSTLYINSTNANNVTSVTCCTTDTVTQAFICSNSVTLTVYSKRFMC